MECNRCGDCCDSMRPGVKRDKETDMPLLEWGAKLPKDLYEERYGEPLLLPVVGGETGPEVGFEFDTNNGKPFTPFRCTKLRSWPEGPEGPESGCALMMDYPNPDPKDISQLRPRVCGEFPVFGLDIDAAIIEGKSFIPPTGATPRCTWYGIRIVGPWKPTKYWQDRWDAQQRGEPVEPMMTVDQFASEIAALHKRRVTTDGSARKRDGSDDRGMCAHSVLDPADPATGWTPTHDAECAGKLPADPVCHT